MSALIAVIALGAANGAPLSPQNPFAWLDPNACVEAGGIATLPREKALAALLKEFPLKADAAAFGAAGPAPADRIAEANCAAGVCPGALAPLRGLKGAAIDMIETRHGGAFRIEWVGQGPEPSDPEGQVRAFYDLSRAGYEIRCEAAPAAPPSTQAEHKGFLQSLAIASSVDEAAKPELGKRDPATVSFRADQEAHTNVGTVKIAVLAPAFVKWHGSGVAGELTVFVAYSRLTAAARAKEINNLDFGARAQLVLGGSVRVPVALNAFYQTDDRGNSSLARFDATLRPPLEVILPRASGYGAERFLTFGPGYTWRFEWDLHLAADYAHVGDPGDKPALAALKSYARVGYDIDAGLRYRRRASDPMFALALTYRFRDDWSGRPANADTLSIKAKVFPTDTSHFSFGVEYGKGEDLSSLVRARYFLISAGYRQ